jgi:hypothetical protein
LPPSATRQNSDLMHELAIFLVHESTMRFADPNTDLALRTHDKAQDEAADWLAGHLLPREVLLHIKATGLTDLLAASPA